MEVLLIKKYDDDKFNNMPVLCVHFIVKKNLPSVSQLPRGIDVNPPSW